MRYIASIAVIVCLLAMASAATAAMMPGPTSYKAKPGPTSYSGVAQ